MLIKSDPKAKTKEIKTPSSYTFLEEVKKMYKAGYKLVEYSTVNTVLTCSIVKTYHAKFVLNQD